MTPAALRPALRAGLAALACIGLAGCAALPFGPEAATGSAATAASRAQYRVEVDAPDELRKLLTDYLDLSRFQNAPDTEAIDSTELTRLAAAGLSFARIFPDYELLVADGFTVHLPTLVESRNKGGAVEPRAVSGER